MRRPPKDPVLYAEAKDIAKKAIDLVGIDRETFLKEHSISLKRKIFRSPIFSAI